MQVNIFAAADSSVFLQPLLNLPIEAMLLPVLWRLTIILLTARAFALLFRKIGQPSVVGEIVAGLVLGPSVLGWLFPDVFNFIFKPTLSGVDPKLFQTVIDFIFRTFAGLGLILLLFLVGLKTDSSHFRVQGKTAVLISAAGVLVPFMLGVGLAVLIHPVLESDPSGSGPFDLRGFALFMGVAMSITALPVLARIMVEFDLLCTRLGRMTIACAAFDDVIGWILLAMVSGLVNGHFEFLIVLRMVVLTVLFVALMLMLGRPIFTRWAQAIVRRNEGELSFNHLALLLAGVMLCAIATNLIGIFALFCAFFLGVAMSDQREFCDAVYKRVSDLVLVLFLPIFFTYTGLRTDISSLHSWQLWAISARSNLGSNCRQIRRLRIGRLAGRNACASRLVWARS